MKSGRKYIILLGDGMADYPIPELGNRTPLEAANTPNMDAVCARGILGLAKTVPDGMAPGSDTANLSVFGYDPRESYSGRAPLEALSMGIDLGPADIALRCNIVNAAGGVMNSFTAGHIQSEFSKVIIDEMNRNISIPGVEFHAGVSYRNIMIWRDYPYREISRTTPPHDIQDRNTGPHLPQGRAPAILSASWNVPGNNLGSAAVREAAKNSGETESVWLWEAARGPAWRPQTAVSASRAIPYRRWT